MCYKKKVAIFTFYYPPKSGPGVQRISKLLKYLDQEKYDIDVYTAKHNIEDTSLINDIKNINKVYYITFSKILEHRFENKYFRFLLLLMSGYYIIPPDIYTRWSIKCLLFFLMKNEKYDTILTTSQPYSVHLIGLGIKLLNKKINWVADFRDYWIPNKRRIIVPFYEKIQMEMEKYVIKYADNLMTVSNGISKNYEEKYGRKFHVIYNGFDPMEMKEIWDTSDYQKNREFVILYTGTLDEERYWTIPYLKRISTKLKFPHKFLFYGHCKCYKNKIGNIDNFLFHEHVNKKDLINLYKKANILLLLNNDYDRSMISGKFCEYVGTKKSIFAMGAKNSEVEILINNYNLGYYFKKDNMNEATLFLENIYKKPVLNNILPKIFNRKYIAEQISSLF